MNTIYHYRNNYNTNLNQKVSSPSFKAYNLEAIKKDLITRTLPSENIIKELRSDFTNLAKELNRKNSTEFISKYNLSSKVFAGKLLAFTLGYYLLKISKTNFIKS